MVPLALPARSLGWGSTRDTLYLKSLQFPCDASSCDDTRVPAFMRQDRTQTRESSLTCIPALLTSSDPEVFFTHSLPLGFQKTSRIGAISSCRCNGRTDGLNNTPAVYGSRLEISHHPHHRHYQDGDEGEHCNAPDLKPRTL